MPAVSNPSRTPVFRAITIASSGLGSFMLGIWGLRFYAVRTQRELSSWIGTFQLVEGKVLKAARIKGRVYLNFGDDWKTDFTVTIGVPARRMFREAGTDPLSLEGKRIRVRGWLKRYNGPMIAATHPEQIEVVANQDATLPGQ